MYTKDASPNYGVSLGWSSHVFAFEFPMLTGANSPLVLCWLMQASSLFGRSLIGVSGAVSGNTFHCWEVCTDCKVKQSEAHIVCHALYIALYKTTACIDYISAEEVKSKYHAVHLMYDVHGFFCKSAITLKASQLTRLTAVSIGRGEDKTYHRTHNVFFITCPVLWNVNCTSNSYSYIYVFNYSFGRHVNAIHIFSCSIYTWQHVQTLTQWAPAWTCWDHHCAAQWGQVISRRLLIISLQCTDTTQHMLIQAIRMKEAT